MQIDRITATVKYSQDTGKGCWKSLELGCEASLDGRENWQAAQAALYGQLAQQFRELWQRNGTAPHAQSLPRTEPAPDDSIRRYGDSSEGHQIDAQASANESHIQVPANGSAGTPDPFCQKHGVPFKARKGPHGDFYSHRMGGTMEGTGNWCNAAQK